MQIKSFLATVAAFLFLGCFPLRAQSTDVRFDVFSSLLSPEKLYLHTDREVYNIGDTIWFRAYLQNASAYAEYKECNYLYVELLSSKFENTASGVRKNVTRIRDRVKVKRDGSGCFTGYFPISEDYNSGLATIRAYSYWMLNFSPEYMFNKNIKVINPMKDDFVASLVEANVTDYYEYDELGVENPFSKKLFGTKEKSEDGIDLQFLPESGRYVAGIPSVMGVKALNSEGLGVMVSGDIFADDVKVARFQTNALGMGKCKVVIPRGTRRIKAVGETFNENFLVEARVPMPDDKAVVINAVPDSSGVLIKVFDAGVSLPDSTFLIVYDKSQIVLRSLYAESYAGRRAEYSDLEPGVNTIAVVDNAGNVYAQRPFFVFPRRKVEVNAQFDKTLYGRRDRAGVTVNISDENGRPLDGVYSVAVTDEALSPASGLAHNIASYMLLGSELTGFIEQPQHYFTDSLSLEKRIADVDALLVTQGWKYYDLEKILKGKTVIPRYGKEYTQSLSGYVNGLLGKSRKSTICFLAPSINYRQISDLDSTARFILDGLDFPDGTQFIVGALGRRKLFEKMYTPVLNPDYFAAAYEYPHYLKYDGYSKDYGKDVAQSYYSADGTLYYTLSPSRIVAKKEVSPYPNDSFKSGEYREEKQLLAYKDFDVVSYIHMTCPGVQNQNGTLVTRALAVSSGMSISDRWTPIVIYVNGFVASQSDIESIMVSDIEAFAYVKGQAAAKYEPAAANLTNSLKPRATVLIKTRWPMNAAPNVAADKPLGWQKPAKFYVPKYETKASKDKFEPMRLTLHWEPQLITRGGEASFGFYTSDHAAPVTLILEGISDEGDYVSFKKKMTITK